MNGRTSRLHILDSLLKIYNDIQKRFKGRKIVISMSWNLRFIKDLTTRKSTMDNFDSSLKRSLRHIFELLGQSGVIFVVPGGSFHWKDVVPTSTNPGNKDLGNNYDTNPINGFPATEGVKRLDLETPNYFVTVGGVETTSWGNYYQTHRNLRVSAPAVDILVPLPASSFHSRELELARAQSTLPGGYGLVRGTAYAAATVAGLLAYFLEMGFDRYEARTVLYAYAYPRIDQPDTEGRLQRNLDVVYNGIWGFRNDARDPDSSDEDPNSSDEDPSSSDEDGELQSERFGALTRKLAGTEKDEVVKMCQTAIEEKWPQSDETSDSDSDGDDLVIPVPESDDFWKRSKYIKRKGPGATAI
ncbi:hypothetical protein TWF730_008328 [Orbilia blumenaviensis]|uniref:Peptidase S8/S53 domain-containing protein n=1 Tax=Orbilia blumenaviensis TaxID=1796055 RepID=A0AAV9V217_9PEZI